MRYDADAVRHAYEGIADGYAGRFGEDLENTDVDRAVLGGGIDLLGSSPLVLDLGCGPGQVGSFVMARGCRAIGVDLTAAMLAVARRQSPDLPLINGDMAFLPVPDGKIDGAIAWFSLHNLPRSELGLTLTEVRRVLRPDGVFLMATHAGSGEEVVELDWDGRTEHVVITFYDLSQLRSALGRHQLKVIDIRTRPPLDHEHAVTKVFVTAIAE